MYFIADKSLDAALHFSHEELFTRYLRFNEPVVMIWQTDKTVMLGNNQVTKAEIDVDFALKENINIVRRSSGGGAIFTDPGTILYTFIEPLKYESKIHREKVAETVIKALDSIGVSAKQEGRNDILTDGKKISGLAQYTSANHICTHGSLLFDTDLELLSKVLIANESKLLPKGITSVRSRVTNIIDFIKSNYSVNELIDVLKTAFICGKEYKNYEFNEKDLITVNKIYLEKYSDNEWNLRI